MMIINAVINDLLGEKWLILSSNDLLFYFFSALTVDKVKSQAGEPEYEGEGEGRVRGRGRGGNGSVMSLTLPLKPL